MDGRNTRRPTRTRPYGTRDSHRPWTTASRRVSGSVLGYQGPIRLDGAGGVRGGPEAVAAAVARALPGAGA